MRPRSSQLLLLIMALVGCVHIGASAQIAPMPYTPASPPSAETFTTGAQRAFGHGPRAVIWGWSSGSELVPTGREADDVIQLEPGANGVVFFFDVRPETDAPIEYRYRLAGYDRNWTVTRNHIAHFHHLHPGDFRFEVQARGADQAWNSSVAAVSVIQRHFFYQTWYFYMLLLVGLAGLMIILLRQRDELLKGQIGMALEERNRLASDFHDTLMAGLAAISWQLEATAKLLPSSDDRNLRAAQSCQLARKMVGHCQAEARRIMWDLRDSDEITEILSQALSRSLTANCLREGIDTSFEVDGCEVPIAPAAVHHLVSIAQEAVLNAIRHSGATQILVSLQYESDSLKLRIRDNGCGFHYDKAHISLGHFGILVMEERARNLGGALRVNTALGTGTEIVLTADFRAIHPPSDREQRVLHWIGV